MMETAKKSSVKYSEVDDLLGVLRCAQADLEGLLQFVTDLDVDDLYVPEYFDEGDSNWSHVHKTLVDLNAFIERIEHVVSSKPSSAPFRAAFAQLWSVVRLPKTGQIGVLSSETQARVQMCVSKDAANREFVTPVNPVDDIEMLMSPAQAADFILSIGLFKYLPKSS
jgi:hypothetical protein